MAYSNREPKSSLSEREQKLFEISSELSRLVMSSETDTEYVNIINDLKLLTSGLQMLYSPAADSSKSVLNNLVRNNHYVWCIDGVANKYLTNQFHGLDTSFYTALRGYHVCVFFLHKTSATLDIMIRLKSGNYDEFLEWPFNKKVRFTLLNQVNKMDDKSCLLTPEHVDPFEAVRWTRPNPPGHRGGMGVHPFISFNELLSQSFSSPFLRNDRITIIIEFD